MKIFRIVINVTYRFGWVLTDLFCPKIFIPYDLFHTSVCYITGGSIWTHSCNAPHTPPPQLGPNYFIFMLFWSISAHVSTFWKYWIRHCTYLYFTLYLLHLYIFIFKDTFTDTYGNKIHQVTHTYTYNTTIRITVSWLIEITKII